MLVFSEEAESVLSGRVKTPSTRRKQRTSGALSTPRRAHPTTPNSATLNYTEKEKSVNRQHLHLVRQRGHGNFSVLRASQLLISYISTVFCKFSSLDALPLVTMQSANPDNFFVSE